MTTLTTGMSQLTFAWPEADSVVPITAIASPKVVPLGIAAGGSTVAPPARILESKIVLASPAKDARRGRPEHISDLLLVVLDRYGISPDEFLAGLQ